jgi:hypothetical protein
MRSVLGKRAILWLLVVAGIAAWRAATVPMANSGTEMRKPVPHHGIVAFELAFSKERAGKILESWGEEGRDAARTNVSWDFLYIVGYVLTLWALTILFALWSGEGKAQAWGFRIASLPFAAGAFDGLENILLLSILRSPESFPGIFSIAAGACAVLKFALLLVVPIFWIRVIVKKVFGGLVRVDG